MQNRFGQPMTTAGCRIENKASKSANRIDAVIGGDASDLLPGHADNCLALGTGRQAPRRQFFFEKKNQKTFDYSGPSGSDQSRHP
jgi:hypothetical protein